MSNGENYNSGSVYNRSENHLLDRSHCFRDRTEKGRTPEEERGSVSKGFRQVGDDQELQLNQWEESVIISENSDFEAIHRRSSPIADRMNYTTQKTVNSYDLHKSHYHHLQQSRNRCLEDLGDYGGSQIT